MISVIALLLALTAPAGPAAGTWAAPRAPDSQITGLSVLPAAGRTEFVIRYDGEITARDFMMDDGRLVIDLVGAGDPAAVDREVNRGGILRVRLARYQPGVARVVLVLSAPLPYELSAAPGAITVSLDYPGDGFEPWTATVAAPATGLAPAAPRARTVIQEPQQRRQPPISVSFDAEPVKNVLAVFAEFADTTILPGPDVSTKTITATVNNLPWDVALRTILEANGMILRQLAGGVLLADDAGKLAERVSAEPPITQQFPIQYVSADSIAEAITGILGEDGTVGVNRTANALIVTGPPEAVERVRNILPQIDVRVPQVDIEAKIAFIDRTNLQSLGLYYDLKDSQGTQLTGLATNYFDQNGNGIFEPDESTDEDVIMLGGNSIAAIGNADARIRNPALQLAMTLLLGRHSLVTFLEALQSVSLTDIQASPMIRTMDHRKANIQVGESTPIRVIDAGSVASGLQAPRATVQFRETGVILTVTPHIAGNQVMMELRAERSNVGALLESDLGVTFQTQLAETHVAVEDGQTIVIGGLTITEKVKSRSGIPLLMDLPVIGSLFRVDSDRENKRDLLVMVTPHIVRDN